MGDNRVRYIFDDRFLRAAWESGEPMCDIAQVYGTSRAALYRAAARFGLQRRYRPGCEPKKTPKEPVRPPDCLDHALAWSRGKWSRLSMVADSHGMTSTQVQVAYHRAQALERARVNECSAH